MSKAKKYKLEITSILGTVLYTYESCTEPTVKEAVEEAVWNGASLNYASLNFPIQIG